MEELARLKRSMSELKLLLVDDEDIIRDVLGGFFGEFFHTVVVAENGYDAMEKLNSEKFDCVITDYLMPKMDGVELAQNIRKNYSDIFIVVMSGSIESLDLEKNQVDYLLNKPASMEDIKGLLRELGKTAQKV